MAGALIDSRRRSASMAGVKSQPRFRQRTEAARERDVFRHLEPWAHEYDRRGDLDRLAFPADPDQPMPDAAPCHDTALVAFAQLVAHRVAVRRCLVTLMSSTVEYVLVESTKTLSLQYDTCQDVNDRAWLGTCSFLRDDGLNHTIMHEWRRASRPRESPAEADHCYTQGSSPHWNIISDLRPCHDLAERGFVRRSRNLRFYASVPLRSTTGSVLGSLTIMDDSPRFGLSATEMAFMEDVADTISQHLDATVVRAQRKRSERMIQSLGLFNNGKSSLRHWWLKQEDARITNTGRRDMQKMTSGERAVAADKEFGPKVGSSSDKDTSSSQEDSQKFGHDGQISTDSGAVTASSATIQNARAAVARDHEHISGKDTTQGSSSYGSEDAPPRREDPIDVSSQPAKRPAKTRRSPTEHRPSANSDFDLAIAIHNTYSRASNLIREALRVDGVAFVNTSAVSSTTRSTSSENDSSVSDHLTRVSSDGDRPGKLGHEDEICRIQAFSSLERSSIRGFTSLEHPFELPGTLLTQLLRRYPQGNVFNFSADRVCYSSSTEESSTSASGSNSDQTKERRGPKYGKQLADMMPGARTIAFFPIWDETQHRFSSSTFTWSTSPLRCFDPVEDITYLASWGHSIMAELGRLETLAIDKAKGSFISSVSHELRSPLHGVLAGVEFLEESDLTSFQQEMTNTISMAGRALLDTVDHILDYAKMSSFTRAQRGQRATADVLRQSSDKKISDANRDEIGVTHDVDLARLTEDVIETAISAHRYQASSGPAADEVSVAINILRRDNWTVKVSPGAWTRIVQNLVGNALKYTAKGLVSVRLDAMERTAADEESDVPGSLDIRLTVQDSGIGISEKFLANHLYTPFKQEDSHSSGTGLGLSIVQQICKDMSAQLKITSELGQGTRAAVDVQVKLVNKVLTGRSGSSGETPVSSTVESLDVGSYNWIMPDADERAPDEAIGASVMETAQSWLNCEVSKGSAPTASADPQVYAITDTALAKWVEQDSDRSKERMAELAKASTHVLILGCSLLSVSSVVPLDGLPFTAVFLHQPIGPRKLLRAIASDRSSTQIGSLESRPSSDRSSLKSPLSPGIPTVPLSPSVETASGDFLHSFNKPDRMGPTPKIPASSSTQSSTITSTKRYGSANTERARSMSSTPTTRSQVESTASSLLGLALDTSDEEPQKRSTILLVEDNELNMKLLVALMRKQTLQFTCATNGREAVEAYQADPSSFCLVLMDMSMPIMDGFTATAHIRETERKQGLPRCSIVALTGVTSDEARTKAFTSGVDEFFSKPVQLRELKELVAKAMGARVAT